MTETIAPPRPRADAADAAAGSAQQRLLVERVRQSVPPRHPAFGKLLHLLAIEFTDSVPTAAVTVGARSRLLLNPEFIARHCRTDAHLAMLVMHELYHVLLGHTRLFRRPGLAANWAFDCIINAQLCRLYPNVIHTSFFSANAAPEGLWSLLGPPPGWPSAPTYAPGPLGAVHRRLYDDAGITTAELFALLEGLGETLGEEDAGRLLGNHATEAGQRDPLAADPDLMSEVRRVVAEWPMVERRGGADEGGATSGERVGLRRHAAARRAVRALLRAAAFGSESGPRVSRPVETRAFSPLPQAGDRRAQLQRLLGAQPLWWQGQVEQQGRQPAGLVTVYLDVSGSMAPWLPVLLEALTQSSALVRWPLLGFSTEVHPVTRAELAAGRFRSTGGTHIACVARHLLDQRVARAVVLTDGDVQYIPSALAGRLRRSRARVRVGLLDGCSAGFCEPVRWPVSHIPRLDGTGA